MNDYPTDFEAAAIDRWLAERRAGREQRRLQRWLAVYCGSVGVVLMLAVGGGCSVALGVVLVAVGGVVWRTA
jgi:drug/metabolite transporter (DMT)-like permease